ncbi:MAG: hypothetical protein GEV08_16535 [Acidimicrobiia bacterium]|nr:hypothetical protein [Acidimicrobiia bacterium]
MPAWDKLETVRRRSARRIGPQTSWHRRYVEYVERLAEAELTGPDGFAGGAAAAFTLFGPPTAGRPPEEIFEAFLAATAELPENRRNPFDLVIAFGSGWGRTVVPAAGWEGRWEGAVLALVEQVRFAASATDELLKGQLGLDLVEHDELPSLAAGFAVSLLGRCDCAHHRRGCGGQCGRGCCFEDHELGRWDPARVPLRAFVDQAVRGTAQRRVLGAAFAEGLLYRALEPEGRVLCRVVEVSQCNTCGATFEGPRCHSPGCDAAAGAAHGRVARRNRLIVPLPQPGGAYVEAQRWECRSCKNLYGHGRPASLREGDARCPRCGWEPPAGRRPHSVSVWQRVGADERRGVPQPL